MRSGIYLLLCAHVVLSRSSHTAGSFPQPDGTSGSPDYEASPPTHTPSGMDGSSALTTSWTHTGGTVHTGSVTPVAMTTPPRFSSPSAARSVLSSPPPGLPTDRSLTDRSGPQTHAALTSQTSPSERGVSSAPSTLRTPLHPITPLAPAPAERPHQEAPFEFNVGDEDHKSSHYPRSPLDPLLAALLSVFIIITAIVFIILFLKFRQKTNDPEFHRLQDLPMDDLMEDTPLSRFSY